MCIYVFLWACIYVLFGRACMGQVCSSCECGDQRPRSGVFPDYSLPYFFQQGLSLSPNRTSLIDWLHWLASEIQGPSQFSLPSSGVQAQLAVPWELGIKLRSSQLLGSDYPDRTIFLAASTHSLHKSEDLFSSRMDPRQLLFFFFPNLIKAMV